MTYFVHFFLTILGILALIWNQRSHNIKQEKYLHSTPQMFEMHFYSEEAAPPSLHGNQSQPPTVVTSITCGPI